MCVLIVANETMLINKIMQMVHQGRIAIRFSISLCLCLFFSFSISFAQKAKDTKFFKSPTDQFLNQIRMEISTYIRRTSETKTKCDLNFFSFKFIVNGQSYKCDSVLFSKSVDQELVNRIVKFTKDEGVRWGEILKNSVENPGNKKYGLVVFVSMYRDECPPKKLYPRDAWSIFNDLMFLKIGKDKNEIVMLGSMEVLSTIN